jgi:ABC-type antimicrobial peptide transport system permease subunit
VPGVREVSAVDRVPDVVVGTEGLLFAAIDPRTFPKVAPLDRGFLTDTSPAAAMRALRDDPHAVLVDKETAESFNLHKGDTVKAQLPSTTLGRPALVTFRVAGTLIQFPSFPLGLDFVGNRDAYEQATGATTPSWFLLRTDGTRATNERVARDVRARLGVATPARIDTTARIANKDQTSLAGLSLTGLGRVENLYTLLIAGLAIVIFVVALLVQRNGERAVMRALGLARRRVHAVILGEATVVLLVSVLVGLVIGVPMAFMFVQILRRIFVVPPSSLTFPTSTVLLLAAVLIVSLALSAALIAAALRRMRLVELLRQE